MNTICKTTIVAIILIFASAIVRAQNDDYYKVEGFGGYSYMNLDRAIELDQFSNFGKNRVNSHGFNGSVTYNFRRYWGAKFDATFHTFGNDFTSTLTVNPGPPTNGTFKSSQSDYQFMGGVQFKDNGKEAPRFKPFAHVLAGTDYSKFTIDRTAPTSSQLANVHQYYFAMKFGGGIDYKLSKNIDVRLIQFDFNPMWRGSINLGPTFGVVDSSVRTNYLFTFGVAFH